MRGNGVKRRPFGLPAKGHTTRVGADAEIVIVEYPKQTQVEGDQHCRKSLRGERWSLVVVRKHDA